MARIATRTKTSRKTAAGEYTFTAVFEPVGRRVRGHNGRKPPSNEVQPQTGYQVTVPLLPGLVTYGRTLEESRAMARDAIRCHLEGLLKDGEPIPDEKTSRKEKLRVALSI